MMRDMRNRNRVVRCLATFALAALSVAIANQAVTAASPARVWREALVIPTYELGPPDSNPVFPDLQRGRSRPVYPYPMLDSLTDRRVKRSYNAVYLENEFLRVTVLPELGGKLYAIFDKTANRDVLYTNHVVKYGIVGIRGAWTSGGIEWNFPDGHTVTTVSPIDYTTAVDADGAASVTVGDTERIQRMQWAVTIRLRPGVKAVETEVTLNNRREVPGRYWFWATAAAPATDDLRFVYPMREAYPHVFWPVFTFPKHKGVDVGTYREVPNALSLFARNSQRDFFGVYYEKSDWGIVHVADHRELAGKKTWTWGTAPSGKIWIDKLTDNDGQYVEFQAGRFETQMEHEFIAPHRVEHYVEYWCPLDKLGGGFDEANRNAALKLDVTGRRARISVNVTSVFDGADLILEGAGQVIHTERINLHPSRPFSTTLNLSPVAEGKPLLVTIKTREGREIISYRTDLPVDGNPDFKPAARPVPEQGVESSAEVAYLEGLAADKKSNERAARAAYNEALKRDAGFTPARIALGLSFYRTGEYDKAAEHLVAALRRNKDSADAHYFLALVRRAQGKVREAAEHLTQLVRSGQQESTARYVLGEMALESGNLGEAIEHISQSIWLDPRDIKARTMLAMALRLAGKLDDARERIDAVVRDMPLDYLALSERRLIYKASGQDAVAQQSADELWRLLAREPDSVLELAFDYARAGRRDECGSLLMEAIRRASQSGGQAYPMLHYALGYLQESSGNKAAAAEQYALGSKGSPAYVHPHRVEEIAVLQAALAANPKDGRAAYYLGNALASKHRGAEALEAWRVASRLDSGNPIAQRNLALALWQVGKNRTEAVAAYERAIGLAKDDFHLYVELDRLVAEMGSTERRIKMLEGLPAALHTRSAIVQSLAASYVDAKRFQDAIALLQKSSITSGEGEFGALAIYRKACLGLAGKFAAEGKHAEAAAEYLRAVEYPSNFGVGRSSTESHAGEYVAAAREYEAAGDRNAAESVWKRAAAEPLGSPTEPTERWSEHYYYKALAFDRTGRKEEARSIYSRLAALIDDKRMMEAESSPPSGAIRFLLAGLGLKGLGQSEQARAAFQRVLKIDPQNERAKAELEK